LKGRIAAPLALVALIVATEVSAQAPHPAASKSMRLKYTVAPIGNEARYRVREQLAGRDLPNDAIGTTKEITGRVVFGADGHVLKDSSRIVVGLSTLQSDQKRRDNYLRTHTLETEKFPQVELVPVQFDGLAGPLSPGESKSFSMIGDLTVRGVTHPTTWQVTARTQGNDIVGTASTMFTFKDFAIDQPKVSVVLGVADTIKLEYDFHFTPIAAADVVVK